MRGTRIALLLLLATPPPEIRCEGEAAMCRTVIAAEQALTQMLATADPAPFAAHPTTARSTSPPTVASAPRRR